MTLTLGNCKLILDKKEEVLWIGPEKPGQAIEVPPKIELWGFGSGDFAMSNDTWFR